MMLSPRNAVKAFQVEKERPVRTGSLPFKKRRFPRLALSLLHDEGNQGPGSSLNKTDAFKERDKNAPTAEKIAALALVAAAASGNSIPTDGTDKEAQKRHGFSCYEEQTQNPSSLTEVTTASDSAPSLDNGSDAVGGKKIFRPPLTSPLPNGCHGRTSRNNAFCRRQPYNGSKFCKSHYLGLVVSGAASEEELISGKVFHTGELPESVRDDGAIGTGMVLQHQDKRYTGASEEVRCKATTTRGRACGYCALDNSKYCHLHATFDTHPPPRRGGSSTSVKEGSAGLVSKNSRSGAAGRADGCKSRRPSTTKNLKKHMEHAPYPLLSTLATEKWLHQKVIVSTGPLTNHVGVVEKWGNGWISVRLPGVGLHNRRSFELYLHPNPGSDDTSGPRVEVFDTSVQNTKAEVMHPPQTPRVDDNLTSVTFVHEVTPLVSSRVVAGKDSSSRMSSILFPTCLSPAIPATIPESPVPESREDGTSSEKGTSKADSKDGAEPLGSKQKLEAKIRGKDGNTIPLMESLMLTQHERSGKSRLDWPFSTAGIQKSRRDSNKSDPEKGGVVVADEKKRNFSPLLEVEFEGKTKRLRLTGSPFTEGERQSSPRSTPVISSSDDDDSGVSSSMVS